VGRRKSRPPDEGRLLQLVYYAYLIGSRLALALPERVAYGLADVLGSVAARVSKKRVMVARNLSRVVGEPPESAEVQRLVAPAFRSYARYWLEIFRLVRESREFFLDRFECRGIEKIDRAMSDGQGVLVVVSHLGNWDAAGAWFAARGTGDIVSIAEVLRPRRMFDFFLTHRNKLGIRIYPARKGITRQLEKEVRGGALVAILGDRDFTGTGPEVEFFGEKTTFPPGPASVALRAGVAPMVAGIYGVVRPDGRRGWEADVSDPIPLPEGRGPDAVAELTREVARVLEGFVARRPEEWHVLHPFWTADRR
jgi:phosphatidylinositol dimannoside acyltransferase